MRILITEDLNCGVGYEGDSSPEFYHDTACATLVAVDDVLYGPANIPAGLTPDQDWVPVAQTEGGAGTAADPYWVETVVKGGDAVEVTQLDTYVQGENSYQTVINVASLSETASDAIIYHGADCYLQDSDDGFGSHNPATGAITCHAPEGNEFSPEARIEEFVPLSAGSNFLYGFYSEIWDAIDAKTPLPDEVLHGDELIDNGIALSWSVNLGAGPQSVSMLTNFSPLGLTALPTGVTATPDEIEVGEETDVSVTVDNPNVADQTIAALTVTLPVGVAYVSGSAAGGDPTVSGQTLTFEGVGPVERGVPYELAFKVRGEEPGVGTISVAGRSDSGAPVLGSSTALEVIDGDVVWPQSPEVVQGSCPAPGEPVDPTVTLPADTDKVAYELSGDVVAGATVQVVATAQGDFYFPVSVDGWTVSENRDTATMSITLDENPCDPITPEIVSLSVEPNPATNVCPATTAEAQASGVVALPGDGGDYSANLGLYKWVGEGERPAVGESIDDDDWEMVGDIAPLTLDDEGNFTHQLADLEAGEYDVQVDLYEEFEDEDRAHLDFRIEALTVNITDCEVPAPGEEEKPASGSELPKTGTSIGVALLLGVTALGSGLYLWRRGTRVRGA